MDIRKEDLKTLWYENNEGKKFDEGSREACIQVSRFPLEVTTSYLKNVDPNEVKKCKHKRKYIKRTFGWVDGIKGRECMQCHGTQVRKNYQLWGSKWEAYGSRPIFSATSHIGSDELLMAMANSGDWTLKEAILICSKACERCLNVLERKYLGEEYGYEEFSDEWVNANTSCDFCAGKTEEEYD